MITKNTYLSDKIFVFVSYAFIILLLLVTIYPFWELIIVSISNRADSSRIGLKLFTMNPDFTAYKQILTAPDIWRSFFNSLTRVILGTSISITLTVLMAYPLSKPDFVLNKTFTMLVLFTMIFSGGLIPTYLLMNNLKLINSIFSLVLPTAVSAYNLIIVRNFLRNIPDSIEESAKIDGANEFQIWLLLILPLSIPVIATVSLWVAVSHWNAYFDVLLYIRDTSKYVLQVILRRILLEQQADFFLSGGFVADMSVKPTANSTRAALIVVSTLPIVMVYPFVQKHFVNGVMIGSVKG